MRWFAISIAGLLLAACQTAPVLDQPLVGRGRNPPMQCVKDFWGNCTRVATHRHAYRWRYVRPGVRTREHEHHAPNVTCHPRRRVVGDERSSRQDAQRAAENLWMGSIRYDYGERFQDLNLAKDTRHDCGPSSPSSMLKSAMFRCALEATPCRAPLGAPVERVERRYEEEEDPPARK